MILTRSPHRHIPCARAIKIQNPTDDFWAKSDFLVIDCSSKQKKKTSVGFFISIPRAHGRSSIITSWLLTTLSHTFTFKTFIWPASKVLQKADIQQHFKHLTVFYEAGIIGKYLIRLLTIVYNASACVSRLFINLVNVFKKVVSIITGAN